MQLKKLHLDIGLTITLPEIEQFDNSFLSPMTNTSPWKSEYENRSLSLTTFIFPIAAFLAIFFMKEFRD